ncbi:Cellulose synthase-like protein E1 [Linum grandiflorum]
MERNNNDEKKYMALFETTRAKSKSLLLYKLFAATIFFRICSVWTYRLTHLLNKQRSSSSWIWVGALAAEIWFGVYWVFNQAGRWNPVYWSTHKDHLPNTGLPGVDVLVCTADHTIEPPLLVVNTVLSIMAYDYPPDKLTVYLSDDGASQFTLYALLEASRFATSWVPFCKRFEVKPRSPDAFFAAAVALVDESKYGGWAEELLVVNNSLRISSIKYAWS